MTKVLLIYGTRPEGIKLCPVHRALQDDPRFTPIACYSGQHAREMVLPVLQSYDLAIDHHLDVMRHNQSLDGLTARLLESIPPVLEKEKPDWVLVQGDTTTCFSGALSAFYHNIPVGHIEAGLRTFDLRAPFPEEGNRQLVSRLARAHFAPTDTAADCLRNEGIDDAHIYVTGNTTIDALLHMHAINQKTELNAAAQLWPARDSSRPYILLTVHRRESFGAPLRGILSALVDIARAHPELDIIYPTHPNPNVQAAIQDTLAPANLGNILTCEPAPYAEFTDLMARSLFIMTDSGGVQEEAPSLDKPVLVLREKTERSEGVQAGCIELVGTDADTLRTAAERMISSEAARHAMAKNKNPYGDGTASQKIVEALAQQTR